MGEGQAMNGEELRQWRTALGLSQAQLARWLHVDVMTVSRWERGAREVPPFLHLAMSWIDQEVQKAGETERVTARDHFVSQT
jgi:DNA-binding transcriptional regulator YiaG